MKKEPVRIFGIIGLSPGDLRDIVNGETTIGFKYDGIGTVFGSALFFVICLLNIFLYASKYMMLLYILYSVTMAVGFVISVLKKDYETYFLRRYIAVAGSFCMALAWFVTGGIRNVAGYILMVISVSYNSFLVTGKKGKWYVSYAISIHAAAMLVTYLCPQFLLPVENERNLSLHGVILAVLACVYIGLTTWFQRKIAENVQDKLAESNEELKQLNAKIEEQTRIRMEMELQEKKLKQERKQAQETSVLLVQTLSGTIEARDEYLRGHSDRVSRYSVLIAGKMGLPEEETEKIRMAATLHDLGKISVPDAVLNKPSRLTDEEYRTIKNHCKVGADLLKNISVISYASDIARHHHERYDGKGYPDGLKGEEIALGARIVAVADSFDAMNSRRVYRNPLDRETIRNEIVKGRGSQFDPAVADAFLELLDSGAIDEVQV